MKIRIRVFGELLDILAKDSVIELNDNEPITGLVTKLDETTKSFKSRVLHDSTLKILINGRNIHTLKGFETSLNDEDVVTFIPLVVGG